MATEYPQRWLREHQAVPTEQGWKRENGELLKVQKGLEIDEEEIVDPEPEQQELQSLSPKLPLKVMLNSDYFG